MSKGIPNGSELSELFAPKVCVVETSDFGSRGGSAAGFNGLSFFFHSFMNCSTTAAWISVKFGLFCRAFERASNESLGIAISCLVVEILWVEAISRTASWNWMKDGSFDRARRGDSCVGFWLEYTRWLPRYCGVFGGSKVTALPALYAPTLTFPPTTKHLNISATTGYIPAEIQP